MKRILLIVGFVIIMLNILLAITAARLDKSQKQLDIYKHDVEILMKDAKKYATKDSLNAVQTEALQITIDEYERLRVDDAKLIKSLQMKGRDLQQVVTAQSKMMAQLQSTVHDSIIYINDTVQVIARCFDIEQPYLSLHGCVEGSTFNGNIQVTDSIILVESVKYKRFLGFLWKTKKIKNRKFDIVSKNPAVKIDKFDVVTIID